MGAVIVMMIHIATPLMVKADSTDTYIDTGNGTHPYVSAFNSDEFLSRAYNQSYFNDNQYYLYLSFMTSYVNAGYPTGGALCIVWNDQETTFEDNILSIQCDSNDVSITAFGDNGGALPNYDKNRIGSTYRWFTFDFSTFESNSNGGGLEMIYNNMFSTSDITYTYYEIRTNYDGITINNGPDISFEFSPTMSGTVSRKQTINGESFTSDSLNMYVSNSGSDGQFAMFIVPTGQSVTFPEDLTENNAGFTSSPLYAYIADEWITCTVNGLLPSMLANMSQLYAPCAWHTILGGTIDQTYYIPWEHMNLQANTSYDIVCYGAPNGDTASTNTAYEANAGALYSVTSDLTDVTEIYRSTFTITDPALYNPDSANGFSHPYDGTQDMSSLFNVSNIAKDENGNLIIRGQNTGSYSNINYNVTGAKLNPSQAFGQFFPFFTTVLGYFPSQWVVMITIGISCIVVIGIIKAVTH